MKHLQLALLDEQFDALNAKATESGYTVVAYLLHLVGIEVENKGLPIVPDTNADQLEG